MCSSATVLSRRSLVLGGLSMALASCGEGEPSTYVAYAGGGFVFNYRTANHYYGFVVRQTTPLPLGSRLQVRFELPGGGEEVIEQPAVPGRLQYKFQTGDLEGLEAHHPYKAVLIVSDADGKVLQRLERSFTTDVDQTALPSKPLVVGPGYQPNPDP